MTETELFEHVEKLRLEAQKAESDLVCIRADRARAEAAIKRMSRQRAAMAERKAAIDSELVEIVAISWLPTARAS